MRHRHGLSRHLPRGSRHLAGQWPRGRHQDAPRRQREERPVALQRAKPRYYQCLQCISEGRQRRAACQQGLYPRRQICSSTAPFRRPWWSRPKTRKRMPRPISPRPSEQLKVLGVDKDHPSRIVNVYAPISGVIIGQNVTNAAAAGVISLRLRDRLHHRRPVHRLDSLRCLRKRHLQTSTRPASDDQASMLILTAP